MPDIAVTVDTINVSKAADGSLEIAVVSTLHVVTETRAGFPVHWSHTWPAGGQWAAENMNPPGTPEAGPAWSGPGLYDAAQGPGATFDVVAVPAPSSS